MPNRSPGGDGLLERARDAARVPSSHVRLNRYRTGGDSMGLHADGEPDLGDDPVVTIVSLGAPRGVVLKPRRARIRDRCVPDLGEGSLLVMGRTGERHDHSGVPRQPDARGEPISLTFLWLRREPDQRKTTLDGVSPGSSVR
jgi:alkylated DNA repair dioxygenase AlkB